VSGPTFFSRISEIEVRSDMASAILLGLFRGYFDKYRTSVFQNNSFDTKNIMFRHLKNAKSFRPTETP
jgi:hypothetical protein